MKTACLPAGPPVPANMSHACTVCRVPGIGHRIKSKDDRDKRVELLQR